MRTAGIVVALALSLSALSAPGAGVAHADASKAWAAAKAGLPGDAKLVVGVDLAAIQKTQLFAVMFPKLRDRADVGKVLDTLKARCKIDVLAVVQSAVIATAEDQSDGAIYLAITGVDRPALARCIEVVDQDSGSKIAVKQDGSFTEVTEDSETSYFAWIGKDVIVVALRPQDKPSLLRWIGGKGALARAPINKALAKVNKSAALWGVGDGDKEIEPGTTAKGFYGALTFAKGNLGVDIHAVMATPAQAATVATATQGKLAAIKQGTGGPAPKLGDMLGGVTIATASNEVVVKASFVEKDLVTAVGPMLQMFGGM